VKGLQVLSHLAQSVQDLARLVQKLHAAGKGVVANCKGAVDVGGVFPVERNACIWLKNMRRISLLIRGGQ